MEPGSCVAFAPAAFSSEAQCSSSYSEKRSIVYCLCTLQDVTSKLQELAAARSCSLTVLAASGALSAATLAQVGSRCLPGCSGTHVAVHWKCAGRAEQSDLDYGGQQQPQAEWKAVDRATRACQRRQQQQ